ncbi:SDR family NAD(P)-dependent oxidoreductase [Streptomyces sp. NPDC002520]
MSGTTGMNDLFDLTRTVAVVTGASRGIGLAIARALLDQEDCVLVNGLDPEETEATYRLLTKRYCPHGRPAGRGAAAQ